MNMNNEHIEPVTDLGLSLGYTNQRIKTKLNSDSGAGVNAGSRFNMTFVAPDPLAELVWSPQNGLSLKCARSNFAPDKRPPLLWDAGPSKDDYVKPLGETASVASFPGGSSSGVTPVVGSRHEPHTGPVNQTTDYIRTSASIPDMAPGESLSKDLNKMVIVNLGGRVVVDTGGSQEVALASGIPDMKKLKALASSGDDERKNNMNTRVSNVVLPLDKIESSAENDLLHLVGRGPERRKKDKSPSLEDFPVNRRKGKGKEKEKASDGDANEKSKSNETVESCNSTGPYSTGKKRSSFEQQSIVGSKRVKKQMQEGTSLTSFNGQDSSFMNWIMNMMKGFNKANRDDDTPPSLALTLANPIHEKKHDPESKNTGFQTIFQSLYCPNVKSREKKSSNSKVDIAYVTPIASFHGKNDAFLQSGDGGGKSTSCSFALFKEKDEVRSNNSNLQSEDRSNNNANNPVRSLWVDRFSQITHATNQSKQEPDCDDFPNEQKNVAGKGLQNATNFEGFFGLKRFQGENDQKSVCKSTSFPPSAKNRSSEVIATVFARRMGALKNLSPSDVKDHHHATSSRKTCFFCGRDGHDLRDCSEITGADELEGLIKNMSSYNGLEEISCLCIRCFQRGHWAISCPVLASIRKQQSENKVQLIKGSERNVWMMKMKESHIQDDGVKSKRIQDLSCGASSYEEKKFTGKEITPLRHRSAKQSSDVPVGMFDAIRKLRLTRHDMLRWMESHNSVSLLSGFFLRLRLGKWEEGFGGTGYHVAYISEMQRETSSNHSKNSISVMVGDVKCLVGAQYVSNQDFQEDELRAWWCATSNSGKIPSEVELKLMLGKRQKLGF